MTPDSQSIAQRLEEAEREIAHLAALAVEQSDTERTIEARRFVVKDQAGQRSATLESTSAGPCLGLFDANGNLRASIGVTNVGASADEGSWLQLYSAKRQVVAELREYPDGSRVALFDENGSTRISLNVSEHGSFVFLFGPDGKQNLRLELFSSGQATLVMQDGKGDPRLLVAVETDKGTALAFMKDEEVPLQITEAGASS